MNDSRTAEEARDYSFEAQAQAFGENWRANFEEAFGMPYEEILKDKELVAMIDASLNQEMARNWGKQS